MPKPKPKKSDPRPPAHQARPTTTNPTPNWPPLRPLLPAADLHLVPLVRDQIYLIRNFLPASLCKNYTSFLSSLPLTTTPGRPKKDEAVRVNDRFQVEDARLAETLWGGTALRELVMERFDEDESSYEDGDGDEDQERIEQDEQAKAHKIRETWGGQPLGLNPNIRIYRYSKGQFFAQHCMSMLNHPAPILNYREALTLYPQTMNPTTSPSTPPQPRNPSPPAQPGLSSST